jgi:hypothetical protein
VKKVIAPQRSRSSKPHLRLLDNSILPVRFGAGVEDAECDQDLEIKSLGPKGEKCSAQTLGLLRRIPIKGGLHHPIGKEISRSEQGQDDFIENIEDSVIRYDGGRVAASESLKEEITKIRLRKATKLTGLDRKTIRAVLNGKKVKVSTLAKIVAGLRSQSD